MFVLRASQKYASSLVARCYPVLRSYSSKPHITDDDAYEVIQFFRWFKLGVTKLARLFKKSEGPELLNLDALREGLSLNNSDIEVAILIKPRVPLKQNYTNGFNTTEVKIEESTEIVSIPIPKFSLWCHDLSPFSLDDLKGAFHIIYFGDKWSTPVLSTISDLVSCVEKSGLSVVPVFVDVTGNTPLFLKRFLSGFHPCFIGVTGPSDQVRKMVYYFHNLGEKLLEYSYNAAQLVYLVDPKLQLVRAFVVMHNQWLQLEVIGELKRGKGN